MTKEELYDELRNITLGIVILLTIIIDMIPITSIWHILKPTIVKTNTKYFDKNIASLYHLKN
jgi:hypothetical protein